MLGPGYVEDRVDGNDRVETPLGQSQPREVTLDVTGRRKIGSRQGEMLWRHIDPRYIRTVIGEVSVDGQSRPAPHIQHFRGGRAEREQAIQELPLPLVRRAASPEDAGIVAKLVAVPDDLANAPGHGASLASPWGR